MSKVPWWFLSKVVSVQVVSLFDAIIPKWFWDNFNSKQGGSIEPK